jgi:hypothetical protein
MKCDWLSGPHCKRVRQVTFLPRTVQRDCGEPHRSSNSWHACPSQIQSPGKSVPGYSFHTLDIKVLAFLFNARLSGPPGRPSLDSPRPHERPDFPIFVVGDESHHLASLCSNRREGFPEPVGRPRRTTMVLRRGPFTHANRAISAKDDRIDGQGLYLLSGRRGQGAARVPGAHQPQFQATARARCCSRDCVEGEIPRTRDWDGAHALANYIWFP